MVTMIVKVKNKFGANLKAPNSPPRSEERDEEEEEQQEEEEEEEEETEEEEEDEEEQEEVEEEEEERGGYLRSGSGSSPSPVPYFHQTRVSMDAAESTPGSPSSSSGGIFQFDPSRMSSIIKRRAMIKELTACYRAKCISHCQNLVELQSQWRQDLEDSHVQQYGLQYHGNNQNCMFEATHTPPQRVKQTSSTVSASNDEAASAELLENSTSASQSPLRKHLTWRSNEREALRRGLMMFGLGRSDKVRSVMSGILKKMRHGLGDIADCCWEFVRICAMHVDEKERMLAEKLYEKSKDLEIESGPEVSSRIGSWDRVEKSASGWLKRLILLDSLANVIRLCASKETQEAAYSAIASLKDGTSPFEWWGREADLALLSGVYKHGFGNYEALRRDPQFTGAFQPFPQKGDAKAFMEVESFQHSYEFGESQYKDRFHSEDDLENVDSREGSHFSWPDANTLTRRLKRLIEHISRIEKEFDVTGKHIKEKPARVWNKKEKTELYKLLMTWGRPLVMGDDANSHWQTVKNQANNGLLKTRNASSIESGIRSIESDMRQILANPNNIEEKDCTNFVEPAFVSGPKFLSGKTAIRLKERIELLDTLRQAVDVLPDDWGHLGSLLNQRNNMPAWWQTCQHDRALVKGVLRHGCGNWDAIFEDDSLFAIPGGFSENDNLPDPKTCMKRLRFIGCHLRRHMKKLKGRRKRSMTDDKENDISNEPRRFKRVRSAEIQRNSDGKPILPLVLTERLTVLDLGTIEYRRPGFHTDRHVFPIGYTSLRNYASMTDKDGRTNYTCEVLDGGTGPVFRVVPEDSPDIVIEKDSASGAWAVVCTAGNKIRGIERGKITISGTEMFGLSHPIICQLLSELPGAEYCSTFAGHSNSGAQIQKQLIKNPVVSAPQDDSEGRNVEINQRDNDTDESESSSDSTDDTDTTDPSDDTDESYEGIAQCRMPEDQNFTSRKMVAHLGSRERTYLDINADPEDFGSS